MEKQEYKLKLPKKWNIYNIFHILILKQSTSRKGRVDKTIQLEFEAGNNKEYKLEEIQNSAVYAMESKAGHLLGLYYLVNWKSYPKKRSTWEPVLAVEHLQKLLSKFNQKNPTKPIATLFVVDSALPMARPTVKHTGTTKQKRGRPAKNSTNKRPKKS